MSPHQNRSTRIPRANPTPEEVKAARLAAGLNVRQAAELIHASPRAWIQWEYVGPDALQQSRRMHAAFFELFRIKVDRLGRRVPKAGVSPIPPPDLT